MRLQVLGATGTVTGSRYLLEHDGRRLLVDCGLFQGLKQLRLRNWAPPPVEAATIDAVVLTHAHIDHSGYLPRLAAEGFRGEIHATQATTELCVLLLPDSGHLQEEDARYANRHGFSKHAPALPLYTEEEARKTLPRFRSHAFEDRFEPLPGFSVRFRRAGHILGAASVNLDTQTPARPRLRDAWRARGGRLAAPGDRGATRLAVFGAEVSGERRDLTGRLRANRTALRVTAIPASPGGRPRAATGSPPALLSRRATAPVARPRRARSG